MRSISFDVDDKFENRDFTSMEQHKIYSVSKRCRLLIFPCILRALVCAYAPVFYVVYFLKRLLDPSKIAARSSERRSFVETGRHKCLGGS